MLVYNDDGDDDDVGLSFVMEYSIHMAKGAT